MNNNEMVDNLKSKFTMLHCIQHEALFQTSCNRELMFVLAFCGQRLVPVSVLDVYVYFHGTLSKVQLYSTRHILTLCRLCSATKSV